MTALADEMTPQRLSLEITTFADILLAGGADAQLLAAALIGWGVELLGKVQPSQVVARSLRGIAAKICDKKATPSQHKHETR